MARDISPEEARDEKIAQLTAQHTKARMAMLRAGDPVVTNAVSQSVSALVTDKWMDELVGLAIRSPSMVGQHVEALVRKVVRDEAEYDAIKDVEQMEKAREQQVAEARAEQDAFVRLVMNH